MLLNIFIILFIIGLAYWQGLQGFFSALIHLILVIVSGTIAFAFWEPIAMGMLSGMATRFAWTLGLVVPFFTCLLVLRFLFDKFVPANVDFSQLTNLIAGGICGAVAAVLTMGIFVIGLSYLPGSTDNFGYRPYTIDPLTGAVVRNSEGGGLWISVDGITESLFSSLSVGTFAPANGKSLAYDQPEIVRRAALIRLRSDENSSTVATPGTVEVVSHYSAPLPLAKVPDIFIDNLPKAKRVGDVDFAADFRKESNRLIAIETLWTNNDKTYDGDPRLRVFPNQVQLVTVESGKPDSKPVVRLPIAISRLLNKSTSEREFTIVNTDNTMVASPAGEPITLTFFFLVPANHLERCMLVRNLRFPLPNAEKVLAQASPEKVTEVLGASLATGTRPVATSDKAGIKAQDLTISADLTRPTSVNLAIGLEFTGRNEIKRGEITSKMPTGAVSPANHVQKFFVPEEQTCLRLKMTYVAANNLYSQALAAANNLNPPIITDTEGTAWEPHGYVWIQAASNQQKIRFEPQAPIRAVSQLPIKEMNEGDELYVYFLVKKNIRLDKFSVGKVVSVELNRFEVK